jgi:hypothetical protein
VFAGEIVRAINKETSLRLGTFHDEAAAGSLSATVFHEPWWLDLASGGAFEQVTVSSGGKIVGALPFIRFDKFPGLKMVGQPLMAHALGPSLSPEFTGDTFPKSLKQLSIIRELIAQLPKASRTSFRLHGGIADTLAFGEAGFSTQVDFTVEIAAQGTDELWQQLRGKTRNVIRRAEEHLDVIYLDDAEAFVNFYEKNLADRGLINHYNRAVCISIIDECLRRGRGRVLATVDSERVMQSAIFTVWDRQTEYYFMSTRAVSSANGATSLLIWLAIQHAARNGRRFDMDMLHVKRNCLPNLRLLTGFGGTIKPRYFVRRTSAILEIVSAIRHFL